MSDKQTLKTLSKYCPNCHDTLENATFLSETFSFVCGQMVFKCNCGQEIRRGFVPVDMLTDLELLRITALISGFTPAQTDLALKHLKVTRLLKDG